ncbi:hypothetical protein [Aeromonas rivipollensis]|uniref:hypothetical protein n=1 Tax=Aeromonas rivipollensis TaxID=948519 RepID=UPI001F36D1EF|nr:hypothetical protein [Aeromonas rivipollensis]MCE9945635.1 hypothetical protein [Aeromonas rivipollensis]
MKLLTGVTLGSIGALSQGLWSAVQPVGVSGYGWVAPWIARSPGNTWCKECNHSFKR